jgi:hypothetical protein
MELLLNRLYVDVSILSRLIVYEYNCNRDHF